MARLIDQLYGHRETLLPLIEAAAAQRLAPTLLFSGPSGIGKRLAAHALAQTLVCENRELQGCGECGSCVRIEKRQSENVIELAPDGAQLKIEQARDIVQRLSLRSLGRSRVFIIDQAHAMNPQAANALLKSLEEPPQGTYFILVTPLASGILPTIRSRSQLVRFRPLNDTDLYKILGADTDPWIIKAAHGSVDTAKKLQESREEYKAFEEALAAYIAAIPQGLPVNEIARLRELMKDRAVMEYGLAALQGFFRDALRAQLGIQAGSSSFLALLPIASSLAPDGLRELADLSIQLEHDITRNVDRGLALETFAIRWRRAAQHSQLA